MLTADDEKLVAGHVYRSRDTEPPPYPLLHSAKPLLHPPNRSRASVSIAAACLFLRYTTPASHHEVFLGSCGCLCSHRCNRISDDGVQRQSADALESISFTIGGRLAPSALGESKVHNSHHVLLRRRDATASTSHSMCAVRDLGRAAMDV